MNDIYDKIAENIFERGNEIIEARKKRNAIITRSAFAVSGLCAAIIAGVGIWNDTNLKNAVKRENNDNHSYLITSETSTRSTETDNYSETTKNCENETTVSSATEFYAVTQMTTAENITETAKSSTAKITISETHSTQTTVTVEENNYENTTSPQTTVKTVPTNDMVTTEADTPCTTIPAFASSVIISDITEPSDNPTDIEIDSEEIFYPETTSSENTTVLENEACTLTTQQLSHIYPQYTEYPLQLPVDEFSTKYGFKCQYNGKRYRSTSYILMFADAEYEKQDIINAQFCDENGITTYIINTVVYTLKAYPNYEMIGLLTDYGVVVMYQW